MIGGRGEGGGRGRGHFGNWTVDTVAFACTCDGEISCQATDALHGIFASRFEKDGEALWLLINKGNRSEITVADLLQIPLCLQGGSK